MFGAQLHLYNNTTQKQHQTYNLQQNVSSQSSHFGLDTHFFFCVPTNSFFIKKKNPVPPKQDVV